ARTMISTVHTAKDHQLSFVKGAVESVLPQITSIEINGRILTFTETDLADILEQVNTMSNQALRVLTIAYKQIPLSTELDEHIEEGLVFLGLTGTIDPPREEVKASIDQCRQAGIRVVMITGDHQKTALAIAK